MKCGNCGTSFNEGIFCPKCGQKVINDDSNFISIEDDEKKKLREENERLKEKQQLLEERKKAEEEEERKKEKQRLEEAERLIQENSMRDLENRTVHGTVYKTEEEAIQARAEHDMIDILKEKLMSIKSQEMRKEAFYEFNEELHFPETKRRYGLLKVKVETPKPVSEKVINIYGISILIALVIGVALMESNTLSKPLEIVWVGCMLWYGIGFWVWIIWRMILFIKQKKSSYYRNLQDI